MRFCNYLAAIFELIKIRLLEQAFSIIAITLNDIKNSVAELAYYI